MQRSEATISVHYGGQCDEDVRQVSLLPKKESIRLVDHDFNDHVLSLHLRDEGKLTELITTEMERFLDST